MIWIAGFFLSCLAFYGGYLVLNAIAYHRLEPQETNGEGMYERKVSILIAARNEAVSIGTCLEGMKAQSYPQHLLEIIVIDDHSEDQTAEIVQAFQETFPALRLLQITGNIENAFKKAAIAQGIQAATGEIILTTDADCLVGEQWVAGMVAAFTEGVELVSGPVVLESRKTPFEEFQALEFMGLIAVGAASIQREKPNMCNGANLAYLKSAFEEVGGFGGVDQIASGDDEFLMHKIHAAGRGVAFVQNRDTIVRTDALKTWSAFKNQRLRWVSKSTAYKRKSITLTLVNAYLAMLSFPVLIGFSFWEPHFLWALSGAFLFKCICELAILFPAARFFDKLHLLKWLVPEQFVHILYVLWVGIAANVGGYTWKGRKVS